jgi:sigma-54 specific flagellar transcriptional regulator A
VPNYSEAALEVADGSPLTSTLRLLSRAATCATHVLLMGEVGVGKTAVARRIHETRARSAEPLVFVKCDGAAEDALERALFGDDRDLNYRAGLFGAARGGTLVIEDLAEMPLRTQARFVNAVAMSATDGASSPTAIRLVATTTHPIHELTAEGKLRGDLLDLFTCAVEIPSIRQRPADAVAVFLACWNRMPAAPALTQDALEVVRAHSWPGNALEIFAFAQRLALTEHGPHVNREAASRALRTVVRARHTASAVELHSISLPSLQGTVIVDHVCSIGLDAFLHEIEFSIIDWALAHTHGQRKAAAELMKMKRTTLVEKLRRRGVLGDAGIVPRLASRGLDVSTAVS